MKERKGDTNDLIISYKTLRRSIGTLGMALPFVLVLGGWLIFGTEFKSSISNYYHTEMRDVFVGIMCVTGVFLISYKGYMLRDNMMATIGGVCAIGVALFPVTAEGSEGGQVIEIFHYIFAISFFLSLAYISMAIFTKSKEGDTPAGRKKRRNRVYRICGWTMVISIALIGVYYVVPDTIYEAVKVIRPVFVLEAFAVIAFGVSWLTKGAAIPVFNDMKSDSILA